MKKCRRCTKPATLHVTEIREGEAAIVHLCDTCAQRVSGTEPGQRDFNDGSPILASKLDELMGDYTVACEFVRTAEFRSMNFARADVSAVHRTIPNS